MPLSRSKLSWLLNREWLDQMAKELGKMGESEAGKEGVGDGC